MAKREIIIIGDGGWGTALALLLHKGGNTVRIWGKFPDYISEVKRTRVNVKFLPGVKIPDGLDLISGIAKDKFNTADIFVVAVPTQFIRSTLQELKPHIDADKPVVSVAKGLEIETFKSPTEIIENVLGHRKNVAALSGPTHAEDVARGLPALAVIASKQPRLAADMQKVFNSEMFRIYTSRDYIGVELGGALKNVIAIAAGICDGLRLGDNAKAALLSRGAVEISRLGNAMGAKKQTFFGISGMGDLITTCYSEHGRNLFVGRQIGGGKKLSEVLDGMDQVAEGVWTTKAIKTFAKKLKVETPITDEIYNVLFKDKDPMIAVRDLMNRIPKSESEDLI